jgi:hypothetical protein
VSFIQARIADLLEPCPSPDDKHGCTAYFRSKRMELSRKLNDLTIGIPLVLGPRSDVGLALDNAYITHAFFKPLWDESDENYVDLLRGGVDTEIDEFMKGRSAVFRTLSICISHTGCLVGDRTSAMNSALREVLEISLGRKRDDDAALSMALDTLYKGTSGERLTCPEGRNEAHDKTVQEVCASAQFNEASVDERWNTLSQSWTRLHTTAMED